MKKLICDLKTTVILILIILVVVSISAVIILSSFLFKKQEQPPKLSSTAVMQKISQISELAVNKLEYRDIVRYESGDIPLLTQKGFTMLYDAQVKVGIDFNEIDVKKNNDAIIITLPDAKILDITIDENSLEFYDERHAVFNWQDIHDTVELIKYAKQNAETRAMQSDILISSKKEAGELIKLMLEPMAEESGEKIVIR